MEKEIEDGEITDYDGQDEDRQNVVPDLRITLNHHSGQTGLNEVRHYDNNTTYYDRDARPRTETTDHERPIIEYEDVPYIELDEWSPENDPTTMTDKKSRSQTINKENATSIKLAETTTHAKQMLNKRNKDDNHNTQKNEPTRNSNSKHSSFESRGIDAHSSDKQHNNKNRSKRPRSRDSERDGHKTSKHRKFSQLPEESHKTISPKARNGPNSPRRRNGADSPRRRNGADSPRRRNGADSSRRRNGADSSRRRNGADSSRRRNGADSSRGRYGTDSPVRGNSSMSDDRTSSSGKYDQNSSTRLSASKPRYIDHRVRTKVSSTEHCNDTDERINKLKEHVLREQNKILENCSSTKLLENGEPVESRFSPDRVQENRPYSPVSERSLSPNGFTQEQEARLVVNDSTPYEKKEEIVAQIYDMVVNWLSQHQQRYLSLGDIIRMINNNPKFQFEFQEADVLKELVEQYDHRFVIEYETNIWPKTNIKICPDHTSNPKIKHQCKDLHICTFYMLATCSDRRCKFGHALFSDHNREVLQDFSLGSFNENQIRDLIRTRESRNITTLPLICKFYNTEGGCSRQRTCKYLHVCTHFVNRDCKFPHCKRTHTFFEEWTVEILESYYGLRMGNATNDSLIELISQTLENGNVKLKREIMKVDSKLLNQQHDTHDLSKSSETGMKSSTQVDTLDGRIVNSITENPQMKWSDMALKKVPEYISLESNDNNDNLDNGQDSIAIHGVTPQSSSLAVLIKNKSEVETKQENIDLTERGTEQGNETVIAALSTSDVQVQNEISDFGENEMLLANGLEMKNVVTQLIQDVEDKVKDFDENEAISRVDTQEKRSIAETVISGDIGDVLLKGNDQDVSIYDSSDDAKLDKTLKTVSGSTSAVKDFCSTETAIDSQITVEKIQNKSSKATQIKQFLQNRRRGLTADIKSDEDFVTSSDDSGISHSLYDNSIASTPPRDESKSPLPETSSSCLPAWTPLKPTSPKHTLNNKDVPYSIGECAAEMRSNKSKLPEDESVNTVNDAGELAQTTEDYIEMELKDEDDTVQQNSRRKKEARVLSSGNESHVQMVRKSYSNSTSTVSFENGQDVDTFDVSCNTVGHSDSDLEMYIKSYEERANGIETIKELKHKNYSGNIAVNINETDAKYKSDNDNENQTVSDRRKTMIKSETNAENGKDLDSENNTDLENETKFDTNIEYGQDNKENTEGVFEMDMLDSERRNAFDEKFAGWDINGKEIGSGEEMDIHDFERSKTCNDIADNDIKEDGDNRMVNDQIQEPGNESVTGATDDDVNIGDVHMVNGIANGNDDDFVIMEELSMELKGKNTSGKTRYRHISGYWQMATSSGLWKDLDAEDAMALQNAVNIWKKYSSEN